VSLFPKDYLLWYRSKGFGGAEESTKQIFTSLIVSERGGTLSAAMGGTKKGQEK